MSVTFKLALFEGPLDLLLHLIDTTEVDIYNIPINEITDQYIAYLNNMTEIELEVTSEFLVMAATLLWIKSKMLLPKPPKVDLDEMTPESHEDPRAELVRQLLEYRKFKEIADHLREKELERNLIYTREPADLTRYITTVQLNPVEGIYITDLVLAFQKALQRMVSRNAVAKISRDEITVKDRMSDIMNLLYLKDGKLLFSKLFEENITREEMVVTFLAMLELMKQKRIVVFQHHLFDDMVIQFRKDELSDGFAANDLDY